MWRVIEEFDSFPCISLLCCKLDVSLLVLKVPLPREDHRQPAVSAASITASSLTEPPG